MNNKTAKMAVALFGAAAVLSGCIKETFPEGGNATQDQIAESPFAVDGLVASVPTKLITNYINIGEHIDFGYPGIMGATDRMAGEVFPVSQNLPGGNPYYDRWQPFMYVANGPVMAATGFCPTFIYMNYYQFIKAANDVILTVGDAEINKEARGIAKAFRASFYLDLARMYDPLPAKAPNRPEYETALAAVEGLTVPIVRENTTVEQMRNNPRATREEMFKFIIEDLDDAEACLTDAAPRLKNLPSLAVVYGLKARTYLWLGGFEDVKYESVLTGIDAYREAAKYARMAIDASGCVIMTEAQWLDPLNGFNKANASWMWAMLQSTDTVLNNLLSWAAHMSPEAVWGYGYGAQPGIPMYNYERIADSDFRKKAFVSPKGTFEDMDPYTSLTEEEFKTIAPYASFKFHTAGGEKVNYTVGNVCDVPAMRVEEMYLTEAEATAHFDSGKAKSLLLDFMSHRASDYSVPGAVELVDEILFQKRIEFWGEGIVMYDMKRLNVSMQNGNNGSNAPSGAWFNTEGRAPWWNMVIPQSAVAQNVALADYNNPDPSATVKSVK